MPSEFKSLSDLHPIPIGGQVFIRPLMTDKSPGGIIYPEKIYDEYCAGRVLAVGPGEPLDAPFAVTDFGDAVPSTSGGITPSKLKVKIIDRKPMQVRVDDIVLFQPALGMPWPIFDNVTGKEVILRFLPEKEIKAILERAE